LEGAFVISGECDEAVCGFGEFVPTDACGTFLGSEMGFGEEFGEVAITVTGADEDGEDGTIFEGEFGAGDGAEAVFGAGAMEAWDTVEAVAIGEGDCGQVAESGVMG
jgi:hypothetical protein